MRRRVGRPASFFFCALLGMGMQGPARAQAQGPRAVVFEQDQRVGGDQAYLPSVDQEEPSVAANPLNELNLVAGYHDVYPTSRDFTCRFAYTMGGGGTWTAAGITPLMASGDICSDPALVADLGGNFYFSYIDIASTYREPDRIPVAKSSDGGRSFPSFSIAYAPTAASSFAFPDKPYIAVDARPGSRFRGTLYLTWTFFGEYLQVMVQTSVDGGATWSAPIPVSRRAFGSEYVTGSMPVVAPDGTAYVLFADFDHTSGPLKIGFSKSTNGGRSWSTAATVARKLPSPGIFRLENGNMDGRWPEGSGGFRSNSFPVAAVAPDGAIYVVWVDFPNGSCPYSGVLELPCINADVRMSVSRDGGKSWSAPVRITDESNATDQFFPWISAHPDGLVSVFWLDKRRDSSNRRYDAFYTNTADGRTFLRNVRVSSTSSDPGNMSFIGDYSNLAVTARGVVPVWTDTRLGNLRTIDTSRGTLAP